MSRQVLKTVWGVPVIPRTPQQMFHHMLADMTHNAYSRVDEGVKDGKYKIVTSTQEVARKTSAQWLLKKPRANIAFFNNSAVENRLNGRIISHLPPDMLSLWVASLAQMPPGTSAIYTSTLGENGLPGAIAGEVQHYARKGWITNDLLSPTDVVIRLNSNGPYRVLDLDDSENRERLFYDVGSEWDYFRKMMRSEFGVVLEEFENPDDFVTNGLMGDHYLLSQQVGNAVLANDTGIMHSSARLKNIPVPAYHKKSHNIVLPASVAGTFTISEKAWFNDNGVLTQTDELAALIQKMFP